MPRKSKVDADSKAKLRVLSFMGICLEYVQMTERVIGLCMMSVLQKPNLTPHELIAQMERERSRTLGYFLLELRKRVRVDHELDERLSHFLKKRNTFIHDIKSIPGWNLNAKKGREVAIDFLVELCQLSLQLTALFTAVLRAWDKEMGLEFERKPDDEARQLVRAIDEKYGAKAREILATKVEPPKLVLVKG